MGFSSHSRRDFLYMVILRLKIENVFDLLLREACHILRLFSPNQNEKKVKTALSLFCIV